jgi:hypothetical protein
MQKESSVSMATFLGAFAPLRKTTISFFMSVRPHGKHGSYRTDIHKI